MMTTEFKPFHNVLREMRDSEVDPDGWLFLPKGQDWTLESRAIFLELLDISPEEDTHDAAAWPEFAEKENLRGTLDSSCLLGVVLNAKLQKPDVTVDELFEAFMYYWEHDAFKDFGALYSV